ncbi:MDR family MFS transporter [Actinopolymorpha pittospori]
MTATAPTRSHIADLPPSFWWLWISLLVTWVGRFVVPYLTIFLTSAVGMSAAQAGWVISAYGGGVVISTLVGGVLADRLGRKVTILASEGLSVAVLVAIPQFIDAPLALIPVLFVYGLMNGAGKPAIAALVADLVPPEKRRTAYALQTWAGNLGYAIGPILAGFLASTSYSLLFYGQALVIVVSAGMILLLVPDPVGRQRRAERAAGLAAAVVADASGERVRQRPTGGLRDVLTDRVFLTFTVLIFLYYCVYTQSTTALPVVMTEQGMSAAQFGYLLTLNGLMLCALQLPSLRILNAFRRGPIMVSFLGLTVVGLVVQSQADVLWMYFCSVTLWTLGELCLHPSAQTTAADLAFSTMRGRYQGIYALTFSGASMVGPVLGGWLYDHHGNQALWLACAGLCTVVAVFLGLTSRARERRITEVTHTNASHSETAFPTARSGIGVGA